MTTTAANTTIETAQEFIRAVQAKDIDAVAATLREDAEQLFMHTRAVVKPGGVEDIIAGRRGGFCAADVRSREEVLAYTRGIMAKFDPLVWHDHRWTFTPNPNEVFFYATGGMVVARTGQPYQNIYLIRFDVIDGKIVRMAEFGNAMLYARLGVRPNPAEFRALFRAIGRMLSPRRSSRSGY